MPGCSARAQRPTGARALRKTAFALAAGFLTDAGDLSFDALPPPACLAFVLPPLPSGTRPLRSSFEAAWVVVGERGGTA